jgi:very-short-patch-repair endonuclease
VPPPAGRFSHVARIEFDGGAVPRTTRAFHEDRRRDRALAARGIHVVRATEPDLAKGASLARELKEILAVRRHR